MKVLDDILSYRDMCDAEHVQTLQRGMNFRLGKTYSVILMSQRSNAPYRDALYQDGITIEYEGHDVSKSSHAPNPKLLDQLATLPSGKLTQNGMFINAVNAYKDLRATPELVKIYEKILPGTWSLKGLFDLIDYKQIYDGKRNVFKFILRLSDAKENTEVVQDLKHTRLIPSDVKREVWIRDQGKCVICGNTTNLHFDHDLPFSKGGTSLSSSNIRLLCLKHNLQKSGNIE